MMANTPFSPGLLPADNPISQWVSPRRNALLGFGAGMLSPGLSGAATGAMQGMALDRQYADAAAAQAKEDAETTQTETWLKTNYPQYSNLPVTQAWELAMKDEAAKRSGGEGFTLGAGDVRYDGAGNLIAQGPQVSMGNAPSGYQWNPDGSQSFIPGGPADPSTPAKTTEATRRNQQLASVIQPELATVEANWEELSQGGNQAANAAPFGAGYGLTSPGYQQATSALNTIAQSYLYSVSGAAAPAEEVRKLVESVTPRPFESPQSIADKKERVRQMAAAVVQAGSGSAQTQQQPSGNVTSSGLQWSLEP